MRYQILGPLRVMAGDREVAITGARERTLLATLLLQANHPVSIDLLVDAIWNTKPPQNARAQLQGSVHRLRRQLTDDADDNRPVIVTEPAGYRATIDPADLDLLEFRRLVARARSDAGAAGLADARSAYRAALGLWRGPTLAGITSDHVRQAAAVLDEERTRAHEQCLDAELAAGAAGELIAELTDLVHQHPHRERLHRARMLALYRAGRQAEALAAFQGARRLLQDELGTEPGTELQQLHQAILNRDPALDVAPRSDAHPAASAPTPRELPSDVAGFTGRAEALDVLDRLVAEQRPANGPVVISAIAGTAGVGKTALAVHWAHRVADRFPDGQVYLNLRGYASGPPLRPIDGLASLLRSLGTPPEQTPTDAAQAAALYRTQLADRRVLVVLDNAGSADQVRPLLPGTPGCLVLVTSRGGLSGLVARDGARRLDLDVLTTDEAQALLTYLLGADRVKAEPDAVHELAAACAHLPLALRIAAASLTDRPARTIASYVAELSNGDRLGVLQTDGDQESSMLAALDLSYRALPGETAHLYRLLGLHPGPDIEPYAAAALADTTLERAGRGLDQLLDAHLLQEPTPGRYVFHDLVRAHAAHTTAMVETEPERRAALSRLLDHYRHAASTAMDTIHPYERERRPRVPAAGTPTADLADSASATAWLDTELPNLLAAAQHAASHGWPEPAWHLSATLHRHLRTRGHYLDAETLHRQTLTAAMAASHRTGELTALLGLGDIQIRQGQYEQGIDHYARALELARAIGNHLGELDASVGLGHIHRLQGRHEQAVDRYQQALEIARTTGNQAGKLSALTGLGHLHHIQTRHQQAIDHYQQALEIARTIGDRTGELGMLISLGYAHWLQDRPDQAVDHYQLALEIARIVGDRSGEVDALRGLADVHWLQGRYDQAADHYRQTLEMARTTGSRIGELGALVGLGNSHRLQGHDQIAADRYQEALNIAREIDSRNWQFEALQGLGRLHHAAGRPETAVAYHAQALELATDLRQPTDRTRAHDGLAHTYHALNRHEDARQHWQHALDILTALGTDHTEEAEANALTIRAHLDRLPS